MSDLILRKPVLLQPKQEQLLRACLDRRPNAPTVLGYGGSRGAAKSGGVRRIALALATQHPGITVWLVRRVWDDLKKDHLDPLFKIEFPELQQYYRTMDKELRLPNGSAIFFIHAGDPGRSMRKARGPQAHYIFLEQAEEFSGEEIQAFDGSNRAPNVKPGFCKKILTFNPGGIGTNYLRRVMWLRQFHDDEDPAAFAFIQAYGWDNYEWFRALNIVDEWTFYHSEEWQRDEEFEWRGERLFTNQRRFVAFVEQTDFGRKLAQLPPSQRIGELLGSFKKFAGQYYADVWEESAVILQADLVARIVKPWWRRWLATDWGFSHYAAVGWFTSGLLSVEECSDYFGLVTSGPIRVVLVYRELVCNDVPEPDLARTVIAMTPEAERREIRDHWIGHDAWAVRGSARSVVEQMDPIYAAAGMPYLQRADIDRVGGWRLLYNGWGSAQRVRKWRGSGPFEHRPEDTPPFFVSASCPEIISAVPMLVTDDKDPKDVRKIPGDVSDDVGDMVRYGLKSWISARADVPVEVERQQTYEKYQDPTARAMAMLKLSAKQDESRYIRRRGFA